MRPSVAGMLEVLALGMVSASVFGGRAAFLSRGPRRAARSLRDRLIAPEIRSGWFRRLVARGFEGRVEVAVHQLPGPSGGPGFRVEARLPVHLGSVSVRGGRPAGERCSVCCGDLGFDAEVDVDGPEAEAAACLTHPARSALVRLVQAGGEVSDGWVRVAMAGLDWDPSDVDDRLMFVARTARLLDYPAGGALERLRVMAESDPDIRVRAATLERLVALAPGAPETEAAVQDGLTSAVPGLRLVAACADPERGASVARRLVGSDQLHPLERLRARALLVRVEGRAEDRAAIRRLASQGGDPEVVAAAAAVLGEVGTPADAALLHALAGRLFTPSAVRRAASAGLARLRRRCGGPLAGALSLCVGPTEGALSALDEPWTDRRSPC